jgi:hypothetical protein
MVDFWHDPWDEGAADLPDARGGKHPNPVANYLVACGCFFLGAAILTYVVHALWVGAHTGKPAVWAGEFLFGAGLVFLGLLISVKTARRTSHKSQEP